MNIGKEKCKSLKRIRTEIAKKFGLKYTPTGCNHEGDCQGTCPKCDEELSNLQRQLAAKGINSVCLPDDSTVSHDIANTSNNLLEHKFDVRTIKQTEGVIDDTFVTEGDPMEWPPLIVEEGCVVEWPPKEKKRVLYKECQIAGITFHDLQDIWDELYEGAELALVRQKDNKYDNNAVAIALAEDYDGNPDNFDFNNILGYVPRDENSHLATMLDLGWANAFECELSQINGNNPHKGSLHIKIYIVSNDEEIVEDNNNSIRVLELDVDNYVRFALDIRNKGYVCFRCGGLPPWKHKYPEIGEKVIFINKYDYKNILSTEVNFMRRIAVGDDNVSYFIQDKDSHNTVYDNYFNVYTRIKDHTTIHINIVYLLNNNPIDNPEKFISEYALARINEIKSIKK